MGRMYIVNHWSDAAAYSGEQIGDRLKDSTALHFNRDGSANVELYSEETALAKKKTSVPLKQRILPQAARVEKLNADILELESAYRNGEFSAEEYTLFRDVAFKKRNRAEELLKRATSIKPTQPDEDDIDLYTDLPEDEGVFYATNHVSPTIHTSTWVDDLPASNSLKLPLQKTLQVVRTLVRWHQKTRNYINELRVI